MEHKSEVVEIVVQHPHAVAMRAPEDQRTTSRLLSPLQRLASVSVRFMPLAAALVAAEQLDINGFD